MAHLALFTHDLALPTNWRIENHTQWHHAQIRSLTKWCIKRARRWQGILSLNIDGPRGIGSEGERAVHSLRAPDWQLAPYIDDVSELGLPFHGALPPSVVSGFAAFSTQSSPPFTHTYVDITLVSRDTSGFGPTAGWSVLTYRRLICIISDGILGI